MDNLTSYEAMAKLCLKDEIRQWAADAANTLNDSFELLKNIDTENTEALVSVLDMTNVLRDDVSVKFITHDELMSNALEQYDGYFEVPKTLE